MDPDSQYKIVILETSHSRRDYLRSLISGLGHLPFCFERESICLDNLTPLNPDLVISGALSLDRTLRFINSLEMINQNLPALFISEDLALHDFVDTNGFFDVTVINTNFEPTDIKEVIDRLPSNRLEGKTGKDIPLLIGNSPALVKIKKMIAELSNFNDTVLISGESGTGKDLLARVIHNWSGRKDRPFVKLNSATLSCGMLQNEILGIDLELFGEDEHNPFGGDNIENSCTVYLDEVGEIPRDRQAELVQIIDEGSGKNSRSMEKDNLDIKIIASTRADLDHMVKKGYLRKDLYYRLNVFRIEIPPLRELVEDIPLLTDFFTDKFCRKFSKSHFELSEKTKRKFCRYDWPGNIRELENLVKKIVESGTENIALNNLIGDKKHRLQDLADSSADIETLAELWDIKNYIKDLNNVPLKKICREFTSRAEKKLITKALKITNWNRKKAAKILNISYKSLINRINSYNLA